MASTEDLILQGIGVLQQPGQPGIITITSPDAQTIVKSVCGETILAVTQLDSGKIVAASHNGFIVNLDNDEASGPYTKLHKNITKWLSNGKGLFPNEIQMIEKKTKKIEPGCKVLMFNGASATTELTEDAVREFVSNGGGLIHAVTPWGWSQLNGGKSVDEIPYHSLLKSVGIQYTPHAVGACPNGIDIGKGELCIDVSVEEEESCQAFQALKTDPYLSSVKEIREAILGDLCTVPVIGIPGTIVCFGPQACAVLSGKSPVDVIVATSAIGEGKVVALSHNGYKCSDKCTLFDNILNWLAGTKGEKHSYGILDGNMTRDDISNHSILFSHAEENKWISDDDVVNFIHEGGNFIYSMTPWGWLQLHPNKVLQQMPYYSVLEMAGLIYTGDYCSAKGSIEVDLGEEATIEHAMKNLTYVMKYAMHSVEPVKKYSGCLSCVPHLPKDVKQTFKNDSSDFIKNYLQHVSLPTPSRALKKPFEKALAAFAFEIHHDHCCDKIHSMVADFPGKVSENCQPAEKNLTFVGSVTQSYPTGIYLPPNDVLVVTVLNKEALGRKWAIQVGCHFDNLQHCDQWKRWPCITKSFDLVSGNVEVSSPFGGLIYVKNPGFKLEQKIEVSLTGGVIAPNFDINDPEALEQWQARCDFAVPWVDLIGNSIQLTVPTECVKDIEDPTEVLNAWDTVIQTHHALRGTSPERREWIVCDVQISVGYMHAGYPIMVHLDIADTCSDHFFLNIDTIKSRTSWGLYHELGHNMQRNFWTFDGTVEVTCNIFTLHAMDKICGTNPWIHPWLEKHIPNMKKALEGKDTCKIWTSSPGVALGIYAQLQKHFGWDAYTTVFKTYEEMPGKDRPKSNQQKIDKWIELFSKTVNKNLCPLFAFWEIPFTDEVTRCVENLEVFIPDDDITRLAPQRMEAIKARYS